MYDIASYQFFHFVDNREILLNFNAVFLGNLRSRRNKKLDNALSKRKLTTELKVFLA